MKKSIAFTLIAASTLFAQVALAEPECTTEPQDKWLSEIDMQKKIVNDMGYVMYKFKTTDGNCYEIYGMGKKEGSETDMEKVEIYFNPVDASIVEKKVED